jgi:hypothetical protein
MGMEVLRRFLSHLVAVAVLLAAVVVGVLSLSLL